jgi:antitoxin (DNA-binding transcriptional repressor) of toxin-antitoxin stability system
MSQVSIHEAKTHLSRLIKEAISGEEVIIAKGSTPLVRLEVLPTLKNNRRLGGAKGLIQFMSNDFDAALDDFNDYM